MRLIRLATATTLVAAVAVAVTIAGAASAAPLPDGDWLGFGRTSENNRHSPLTEITPANVAQLGRAYTVDFKKIDPGVKIGEQSYPVAVDGQLYVTTNDDNVFKIDGATGQGRRGSSSRRHAASSRTSASSRTAASPTATASSSCSRSTCTSTRSTRPTGT